MAAAPIACMLSGSDFKERLAEIAKLNGKWLRGLRRDGLRLQLTYDRKARPAVERMVAQEQACCPFFLAFELVEKNGALMLDIIAPEEAREAADAVFEPFVQTGAAQAGCGCCGASA